MTEAAVTLQLADSGRDDEDVPDETRARRRRAVPAGTVCVDNVMWEKAFLADYPEARIGRDKNGFYGRLPGAEEVRNADLGRLLWEMERLATVGSEESLEQ